MPTIIFAVTTEVAQLNDFFVGWGTLSLINAGLAQSKNRSGLAWWIASLFLGPVATFLIVISDKVERDFAPSVEEIGPKPRSYSEL